MFAIDCLKANGTHLGTCIDRFYFGSCCHIEPMHDIVGNTIDTAIIPSRQPPSRVSSTTTKVSASEATETTASSSSTQAITTTPKTTTKLTEPAVTVGTKATATKTTTSKPTPSFGVRLTTVNTTLKTTARPSSPKPKPPIVTSPKPTSSALIQLASIVETTEVSYKLTTFQTVEENTVNAGPIATSKFPKPVKTPPTSKPSITTKVASLRPEPPVTTPRPVSTVRPASTPRPTSTPRPISTARPTSTPSPASTFRPASISRPASTIRPTSTNRPYSTSRPASTHRPASTPFRPRPTQPKLTIKPRPQATTAKPLKITKPTFKPIPISTRSPTKATKPTKITTIKKTVTTTRPATTTARPTSARTTQRSTTTSTTTTTRRPTEPPLSVTQRITLASEFITKPSTVTTKPTTAKQPPSTKLPPTATTLITTITTPAVSTTANVSTTQSNDLPVVSSVLEAVNGNPATNEIEQPKPLIPPPTTEETGSPSLVTWALVNDETTAKPTTTLSQEWMPITTPDGWVLLPSLSTLLPGDPSTTSAALNNTENNGTSSEKPLEAFTSTTAAPFNYSTEASSAVTSSSTMSTAALPVVSSTITNLIDASSTAEPSAVNMTDFTDVCGRRMYPEARIVGGERATFGKWPWQISLRQWRTSTYLHKCGAALLNENWAITAAHCVDNVPPSDLLLRLGEHDLSTDNEPYIHQERRVQIVASHPQFDPRTFEYDLALLRFYEPVQFQPNIIPVCVPSSDENFVGRAAYVTGWGRLYEDGPLPSVLQEVSVPVINNTVCESMYRSAGYIEHIPHIFICAGWKRGGFDSCEGDSGGPMVIQRPDKRFLLAGVISWGIGCAEPNQPGVYTRISEFRDWINQILQF